MEVGQNMTKGRVLPLIVRFTLPLLLANLIQQLYNAADTMIVGKVMGSIGTVGVSTGGEIVNMLSFIGYGYGNAAQITVAQYAGAKEREKIGEIGSTIYSLMLIISTVGAIGCILFTKQMLIWLNCPEEAFSEASNYMRIVSAGLPFVFGYNVVSGLLRGVGEAKKPLLFVAISAVTNVFLDILLVKVIPLGAAGSAIATVMAQAACFIASVIYLSKTELKESFSWRKIKITRASCKTANKVAVPLCLQSACIHLSQLLCVSWVNTFGLVASSANSIGSKISRVVNVITQSMNGSCGAMVGQNIGAREHERVKKTVFCGIGIGLAVLIVEAVFVYILPGQFCSLFTDDPEVIEMGIVYMHIAMITFILNAFQGPFTAVVTGTGKTGLSFIYGALDGIVLRLGISYVLAIVFNMGIQGYWYGNALAHLGPVVIAGIYFASGKWKTCKLIDE